MGTDRSGDLLDVRASGEALVRILYRDLVTVVGVSLAWTLAALPVVTIGAATLAVCETMTRVVTDHSADRLLGERDRLRAFGRSFRANLVRGLPLSALSVALLASIWGHAQVYALSEEWLFSVSTLVGLYFLVIGTAWVLRAASLVVRAPPGESPGTRRAFVHGAELALEHPYFTVFHLLTVGVVLFLASLQPVAVPLLVPGTVAATEVVAFEELVDGGAADIRQYYREVA